MQSAPQNSHGPRQSAPPDATAGTAKAEIAMPVLIPT